MAAEHYPPHWLYQSQARDFVEPPTASVRQDARISDVVSVMSSNTSHVAVMQPDGTFSHLAEAHTILQWFARGLSLSDRLPPPVPNASQTIPAHASVLTALSHMIALERSAIPVVDGDGRLLGLFNRDRILTRASGFVWDVAQAGAQGAASGGDSTGNPRTAMRQWQLAIAETMLDDEIPAEAILATITGINNEVHRRVLADAITALENDGWGTPPILFSFLVLGSSGRMENFLDTDQDNALIIGEPEPNSREATQTYFIAFAERIADGLAASGFPHCKGNMMGTSPVWRKTADEWRRQIRTWVRRKEPVLLMNCDALLDMSHVAGHEHLAKDLHRDLLDIVRREPGFLRALYGIEEDHGVGLDWLGRLAREKDDFGSVAELNLKLKGLLPLIEGARLLAVSTGLTETSTVARFRKLCKVGVIHEDTMADLIFAFRMIAARLLRHQIAMRQLPGSSPIRVAHASMSRAQQAALRAALRDIARFRSQLPSLLESAAMRAVEVRAQD